MVDFKGWPKMTRENPFMATITEKMDGTNACIIIENGQIAGVQSRKRIITIDGDNYGFAAWVFSNKDDLLMLGDGYHFGEWAGLGIQKNPHNLPEKQFFLFNTTRWTDSPDKPECCKVVRVLFEGIMTEITIQVTLTDLELDAPEGETPEGICVYWHAHRSYTKHTIKSPNGKWYKG